MSHLVLVARMCALARRGAAMPPKTLAFLWVQALVLPLLRSVAPEEALERAEREVEARVAHHRAMAGAAPPAGGR